MSASTNDDVLVSVENVSKKFCRSLKKSLWYGVTDIASALNPFCANHRPPADLSKQLSVVGGPLSVEECLRTVPTLTSEILNEPVSA